MFQLTQLCQMNLLNQKFPMYQPNQLYPMNPLNQKFLMYQHYR
jgi:hypothetical protein